MVTKALVILSGGQDSTTTLFWARNRYDEIHTVTFDYGQRHRIEIEAANKVAEMAGVKSHEVIAMPNLLVSSSPLTSQNKLTHYENFEQMEKAVGKKIEVTFVPMRNTLFFVVALNRALALNCRNLITGICGEDDANYPDCTEPFREAFQMLANVSLAVRDIKLIAPLMHLSKAQTVQLAMDTPGCWAALAFTHTSYDGKYPPTDPNHSNILRAHGFEEAGLPDPLVLRAHAEGLMDLPKTPNYQAIQLRLPNAD